MMNFILRMKLKVILFLGTASIGIIILSTILELLNKVANPKSPQVTRLASEVIASDLQKVIID